MNGSGAAAQSVALEPDELGSVLREYMEVTARLQNTHETLQREVIRLRDELASKNRELEVRRRLAALGELAAGVAHEVRNPLGAIQLYSSLLRKECGRLGPALRLIDKIETGIRAIEAVVQDTLALVPRPGQLVARRLQTILNEAHEFCRPALTARQVSLALRLVDPAVGVLAEGDGLQRVLMNLIVNAAEASSAGSTIRVEAGAACEGEVEVRVTDEGSGLSEEVLERLFDPFFTTKPHGTGLGLTIAHRLVTALGGRLTARNQPTGGAEFTLVLPVSGAEEGLVLETQAGLRTAG
jgi:two-component system sensor histidine kinase HydH